MTQTLPAQQTTRRAEFWAGARAILPLIVGAIPFGIIFGALAITSGLTAPAAAAMSALVFAGSAQFIAAGMVATGASVALIVATTLVVNLRHLFYGITLGPHLRGLPQRWLLLLGFLLTDETFVTAIRRYDRRDQSPYNAQSPYKQWFYLGAGTAMYLNWQLCTALGVWLGQSIANPHAWGLDFAIPLTFIGMLVPSLTSRPLLFSALGAAIVALSLRGLPHHLGLVVAVLAGITLGVLAERLRRDQPAAEEATP